MFWAYFSIVKQIAKVITIESSADDLSVELGFTSELGFSQHKLSEILLLVTRASERKNLKSTEKK
jgi:hypothetical protein